MPINSKISFEGKMRVHHTNGTVTTYGFDKREKYDLVELMNLLVVNTGHRRAADCTCFHCKVPGD